MHSATRRRSPPESVDTSASPGGSCMASIAISICRSSSQAFTASILSCTRACSASSLSIAGIVQRLGKAGVDLFEL